MSNIDRFRRISIPWVYQNRIRRKGKFFFRHADDRCASRPFRVVTKSAILKLPMPLSAHLHSRECSRHGTPILQRTATPELQMPVVKAKSSNVLACHPTEIPRSYELRGVVIGR